MKLKDILKTPISSEEYLNVVRERVRSKYEKKGYTLKEKAQFADETLLGYRATVLEEADRALLGMHLLPGTGAKPYFVGNPPDWFANPVQHNEYVFHLNRMNHWRVLLAAYAITEKRAYAQKVVEELCDWIEKCPRPEVELDIEKAEVSFNSVNGWRSLEAGIRTYKTWPWVIDHLIDTEFMTPDLLERFVVSIYEQGEVLADICPLFWPNADHNHYLMENLGLLTIACMFPELKKADKWKEQAIIELQRCAEAQITSEGGQIEGCPSYHNGCVKWFVTSLLIAKDYGFEFPKEYSNKVKRSLNYSIYSFRPSGTGVPWGDSSTNKGAIGSAINGFLAFESLEWLKFICNIASKEDVKKICNDRFWVIPDIKYLLNAIDNIENIECNIELPRMCWHKELKQVTMRTDWTREALSVFFACRTPIQNNHAHIDPMGFDFTALGKPLVVDPGKFTYREDENRRNFKSAQWHNTLTIDLKPPFEYISSWKYGPQKEGDILRAEDKEGIIYAEAIQYSYEPAIHKRGIAIIDNKLLLVLDEIKNISEDSSVQIYYHIDSPRVTLDMEERVCNSCNEDINVALYTINNVNLSLLPGKVSDRNDVARESVRLCLNQDSGDSNRCFGSVIIPYKNENKPLLRDLSLYKKNDRILCTFVLNEKEYSICWDCNGIECI